jgi:hypothetical protein
MGLPDVTHSHIRSRRPILIMFDKPEVFISYSREAPGARPDLVADPDAFAVWRERTIAFALLVALEDELPRRNVYVWRDERAMQPGDTLGHEIDAALLSCAGAVLLIDKAALERSSWVRWESSILTWRRRIGMAVRVVPVLIGVAITDLEPAGYGPARVDDLLALLVPAENLDPDTADFGVHVAAVATKIADGLGPLEASPCGPLAIWIEGIADCLPRDNRWVPHAQQEMGVVGPRLLLSASPHVVMARELVGSRSDRLERLLTVLANFSFADAPKLRHHLEPVWVPSDILTKLPATTRAPPGQRVIALNAQEAGTGTDVVRRAHPGMVNRQILEWTIKATTPSAAVDDCVVAMQTKWGSKSPDDIIRVHGACFVIVSVGAIRAADLMTILSQLALAYPTVTYVVMVGPETIVALDRLEPDLEPGADKVAHDLEIVLDELISGAR